MTGRAGVSLLEVVIAVAIFELGVLAAAGTLFVAARTLAEAQRVERAAGELAALADSLLATPGAVDSEVARPAYRLRWSREGRTWRLEARAVHGPSVEVRIPWTP